MPGRDDSRRFPHRGTRAPIYDGLGSVKVIRGLVRSVDPTKYTCVVIDESSGVPIEGVPVAPTYINTDGGGIYWLPEENTPVWLLWPSTDRSPVIISSAALPRQIEEGNAAEDPNDFRMNRPVLNQGDLYFGTGDGNFITVRRGGVVEIGANQTAQRFFIPLQNLIRDFCENYELITTGGSFEMKDRRVEGADLQRTPVELRLLLKEFAQDDPIIDIGLGRIKEEDDQKVVDGQTGAIVARVIINNRFKFWIDRDGNIQQRVSGVQHRHSLKQVTDYYHQGHTVRVLGQAVQKIGTRSVTVTQNDDLVVEGGRSIVVKRNLIETVTGAVVRTTGPVVENIAGGVVRTVVGTLEETVTGNDEQAVAGTKHTKVGESWSSTIGGRWTVEVTNQAGDPVAIQILSTSAGENRFHSVLGKIRLSSGGTPTRPTVEVTLKPSGALIVKSALGLAEFEVNSSGLQLRTKGGSFTIDRAGTLSLGGTAGLGNVVTTLTHPVDYVTGAPILGTSRVRAAGPGVPGPSAVPSLFLPDNT